MTGRLGRDAEIRNTKNGHTVANFSVAINKSFKDRSGEWHRQTSWQRVQAWDKLAKTFGEALKKGVRVYVEGRLVHRNWIDRQNQERVTTEIVAGDIQFLNPAGPTAPTNATSSLFQESKGVKAASSEFVRVSRESFASARNASASAFAR